MAQKLALVLVAAHLLLVVQPAALHVQDARLLRQFIDRFQPTLVVHPVYRRVDPQQIQLEDVDDSVVRTVRKRNNAEVVNHILKNFGSLDRLGDVGK